MNEICRSARSKRNRQAAASRPCRTRGSIIVNAAIAISLVVIVLIGTELGFFFFVKRELQKAVDLSALAGAQVLKPTTCAAATSATQANAAKNLVLPSSQYTVSVTCGVWNPTKYPTATHFSTALSGDDQINALSVTITATPSLLFPSLPGNSGRTLVVQALAVKDDPIAVFTVGSKLIDVNANAPLISILKFVGADIANSCVGCYTGLAGVKITPAGLLAQLGIPVTSDLTVGGLNALLAGNKIAIGTLLDAIVKVAGQSGLLNLNASLVSSLVRANANVDNLLVQLGTDPAKNNGVRGLFAQINGPTAGSALDVQVDALDLLTAAVGVGTSNNAVNVKTNVSALGITLQAKIVEPPSVGIGTKGAQAFNSQIRVFLSIDTNSSVLSGLLAALGTSIHLPITLDVVNALGKLDAINCDVTPYQATIIVNAPILSACVGDIPTASLWSKTDVCSTDLASTSLIKLLGAPILQGKVSIPALDAQESVTLAVGQTKTTTRNLLKIGDTVASLLQQLLGQQLLGLTLGGSSGGSTAATRVSDATVAASLADYYLSKGSSVSAIKTLMTNDGMTWSRPAILGLLSTTMPDEWEDKANGAKLFGGCAGSLSGTCARDLLTQELLTRNQDGLVTGILNGLVTLVSNLLGLNANSSGTPLLSAILGPIIQLLQPILNTVGGLIANLLGDTLGLELGRTDVHLQSVSCQRAKLVY